MREIKFRGKRLMSEDWEYGNLIQRPCGGHFIETSDMRLCPIQDFSVGQFTGLYDWCGNEIYEGDILESLDFDKENKFVVEWNQVLAQFQGRWLHQPAIACDIYSMCHGSNYGVCGNIHDNPELLKTTVI